MRFETCHGAERPDVCRSIPSYLKHCFRTTPDRCANHIMVLCVGRIVRNSASTICQFNLSEPNIPLCIVYQDVVGFDIYS